MTQAKGTSVAGGFLEVALDFLERMRGHRVAAESARIAYFFFLSLFPFLISLLALTGIVGGEEAFRWIVDQVGAVLPSDAQVYFEAIVLQVTGTPRPGTLTGSLLLMVFLASNIFAALFDGLNAAYHVERRRRWWRTRAMAVALLLVALAAMLACAIVLLAGPELTRFFDLGRFGGLARLPVIFLVVVGMLWLIYYLLPYHDQSRSQRRILVGAVVGALLWGTVTFLFRLYVANFGRYMTAYGVVWGVMLLLVWMYLTAMSILVGGEVAAMLEERHPNRAGP